MDANVIGRAMRAAAVWIGIAVVTGCGGGAGNGTPAVADHNIPSLTLTGTAATGAAITSAVVDVKCASGAGSSTTLPDGTFAIRLSDGGMPCVLRVTSTTGNVLYSVVDGTGAGTATVNITPLTQLIVAAVTGADPAALLATFDAAAQAKLTPIALDAAIASVAAVLQGVVDLSGVNPIKDPLVAANGSSGGNALDQKLVALQAALLAAQTTLAELTSALASGGASIVGARTIVQPAAASCPGLRSGGYRVISPYQVGRDAARVAARITVDALALTFTDDDVVGQPVVTLAPDPITACMFTFPGANGAATWLASPSGLSVWRTPDASLQTQVSVVVPEHQIRPNGLAGTWNFLANQRAALGAQLVPKAGTINIDASGRNTGGADCSGLATCTAWPTPRLASFVANAAGGFTIDGGRAFAFQATNGEMTLYIVDTRNGSLTLAARQSGLGLPSVGAALNFWDFSLGSNGAASPLSVNAFTVKAVDLTAQTYTRERPADGSVNVFRVNLPRSGLRYRAANSSPTNSGGTVNFLDIINMPLPGTGVSVTIGVPATPSFFEFSINSTVALAAPPLVVAPAITSQPPSASVVAPHTATFIVTANGTAPLAYQWRLNGNNITSANGPAYTTPTPTSPDDDGSVYTVLVSNSAGSVLSAEATLTVTAAPAAPNIAGQPTNVTVAAGQSSTFSVVATGTGPLGYQWRRDGTNIAGATSASYTTPPAQLADSGGQFSVVISNIAGSVTSSAATLTVEIPLGATMVSAGAVHSCAVTTTAKLKCWGSHAYDRVGGGFDLAPSDIAGLTTGVAVASASAGLDHTCVLTTSGGVKCLGTNGAGQLGDGKLWGTSTYSSVPIDVVGLGSGIVAVSTGGQHNCALTAAGGVKCWGYNGNGSLGIGGAPNVPPVSTSPVDVIGLTSGVVAISAGLYHTCALSDDATVSCWGLNGTGQVGIDSTVQEATSPVKVANLPAGAITISAGGEHTCALIAADGVYCWGANSDGQLGTGSVLAPFYSFVPAKVTGLLGGVQRISAGRWGVCAVTANGGVKCWGSNIYGQIGNGTVPPLGSTVSSDYYSAIPVDVLGLSAGVSAVSSGAEHVCARTSPGNVKCWGRNQSGQLGFGGGADSPVPVNVVGLP